MLKKIFIIALFTICLTSLSQNADWDIKKPFEQKVFIENKGQLDDSIKYSVSNDGLDIYFTRSGLIYKHIEEAKLSEEERERLERKETNQKKSTIKKEKEIPLSKSYFLNLEWIGADPNAYIIPNDKASNYFTYSDLKDQSGNSTIKADVFKKIIYKNIYPNIDIEYSFPENKEGIKYTIILHPGADPNLIKMKYDGAKKISSDVGGNIKIISEFGNFIDHAPITFYQDGSSIKTNFKIKGNNISFQLDNYDSGKTIIIDPWVTAPTFADRNSAYDIDWDYNGNVFIYGGQFPFRLMKLDNFGNIKWTFITNAFTPEPNTGQNYGDFAIDRNSGTSYICEGFNGTVKTRLLKINTLGFQLALFQGDTPVNEMWRIAFNSCTHQGVIGCGNTSNTYQGATFDTSLVNITPVNILSTTKSYIDISFLAIDDTNCYMVTTKNDMYGIWATNFDNTLLKCPVSTLAPTSYMVSSGYNIQEGYSIQYSKEWANGFNGIAKSGNYLYTYDGATLKKWNPWNGAFLSSVTVSLDSFKCGGIAVDDCDNLYLGCINSVKKYNSNLTYLTSVSVPDSVYDVTIGSGGQLFACGKGFVSALSLPTCYSSILSLNTSYTPATCAGNDGTATVSVIGGTPPFNYIWLPGGQTTSTATGLSPGTYRVIVSEKNATGCSKAVVAIDTVIVLASSGIDQESITHTDINCYGLNNGTAEINVSGGASPYSYLWSPGGQTTQSLSGLSPGTYTVTVKDDNNCQTIDTVRILSPMAPLSVIAAGGPNISCGTGSVGLNVSGGTTPYTYLWSTGATSGYLYVPSPGGTYSVTVTDANGCQDIDSATVSQAGPWFLNSTDVTNACNGNNGSISLHLIGNNSCLTFTWYDYAGNVISNSSDSTVYNLTPGQYTCYISDCFCAGLTLFATVNNFNVQPTISGINNICIGQSTAITASGGNSYLWNNGYSTSTINVSPVVTTSYTVAVTNNGNNCTGTATITITVDSIPVLIANNETICQGNSVILEVSGADLYTWSPFLGLSSASGPSVTANPLSTTTYTVIGTNGACNNTINALVTVNPYQPASFLFAGENQTICLGDTISVGAMPTPGNKYTWFPNTDLADATSSNTIAFPKQTTLYVITVIDTASNYLCKTSGKDSILINVEQCVPEIPNVFTPNNDGTNDEFTIKDIALGHNINIYNRWGLLVYSKSIDQQLTTIKWDGKTITGSDCSDGVYYYVLVFQNGKNYTGFVQLLK